MVVTIKEIAEMSGVSRGIVKVIAKGPNQQEYVFVPYYSWRNRKNESMAELVVIFTDYVKIYNIIFLYNRKDTIDDGHFN